MIYQAVMSPAKGAGMIYAPPIALIITAALRCSLSQTVTVGFFLEATAGVFNLAAMRGPWVFEDISALEGRFKPLPCYCV